MKKKIFIMFCLLISGTAVNVGLPVWAGFQEHYNLAKQYFYSSRYSSAIDEFKKALMINFLDNSARIGLINSYLARGTYIANCEHNYRAAADDFRSALFYLKYYVDRDAALNAINSITSAQNSLRHCEKQCRADMSPEGHYKLAEELNNTGNFSASMYEYEQIINLDNYRKIALLRIASMMKSINNLIKSSEYYKAAIECSPEDISTRMRYANVLDKIGDTTASAEQYNYILSHSDNSSEILCDLERIYLKKLEASPNNAELLADIGVIKQRQGKYAEAYNYYKEAQTKPVLNEETAMNTQLNMGTLMQAQGEYDKAIAAYKGVLSLQPKNFQANLYLAQCYESKQDCQKLALEQYRKLKEMYPDNAEYRGKVAQLTRTSMTPEDIYDYVRSKVSPEKSYVDELYDHALDLHEKTDYDNAIRYYIAVKNADPQREGVYENLAVCYAQKKDYNSAKEILNNAQEKFPENKNILKISEDIQAEVTSNTFSGAYEAYNAKNYAKSLELYSSITPQATESLLGIAASYQGLNQTNKAIEYYKKALETSPDNADIAYSIGALYANNKNYAEAKEYFQKSLQSNPLNLNAKQALADVKEVLSAVNLQEAVKLKDEQKYEEALKLLNTAASDNPQNFEVYFYRGSVYDAMNRPELAIDDYKKSLQYNSAQEVTYYLIAVDYDNINNRKLALEYYKKFLELYKTDDEYSQYVKARIPEIENELTSKK